MEARDLYVGTGEDGPVGLRSDHLTTHAVCLGMTGSGKTGLGIVVLEELARRGVPLLVVDLKGDMLDLLLNFPELRPEDFRPWLPPDLAREAPEQAAAEVAALWRRGLEGSGLGPEDLRAVAGGVRWQVVTPGLEAGAPLDVLPSLSAPEGWTPSSDPDGTRERVQGVAGALLSLVDRGGDPLTDRDMVLLSSVLLELWRQGGRVDLARLLAALADPPLERLGVLPLETMYPRKDRMELVLALNTLLASPAFGAWTRGTPLDMDLLLGGNGEPRATVVALAHLDEAQRLFVMTLLFSELMAWTRRQPASGALRALLYVDEVQGILPPHPHDPPTKRPLLTLLKQGRAFGVGAWLATQNPVDLDYKALGNAGIKVVGRLITDRDRERALEGLGLVTLEDGSDAGDLVAGLERRQFLLHDVRAAERLRVFSSRWAMSYLRGPVAAAELGPLVARFAPRVPDPGGGPEAVPAAGPGREEERRPSPGRSHPPVLDAPIPVLFGRSAGEVAAPWLLAELSLTVERRGLNLFRRFEERWRIPFDSGGRPDWDAAEPLDGTPDLAERPPEGMVFPRSVPPELARHLGRAAREVVTWRARVPVPVLANRALKLAAEAGEDREAFLRRCLEVADRADDAAQERARRRFERRIETLRRRLEREREELARDRRELEARKAEEKMGLVDGLMSVLLGSGGLRGAARRAGSKTRAAATKRRMRRRAEAAVEESLSEIQRLEAELEDLEEEMVEEIGRIAAQSEAKAERLEEVPVRPRRADVVVERLALVWE